MANGVVRLRGKGQREAIHKFRTLDDNLSREQVGTVWNSKDRRPKSIPSGISRDSTDNDVV